MPASNAARGNLVRKTQAYARKRAIAACQLCRARRTKCDNLRPSCSACLKLGVDCITNAADYSSFDPASLQIIDRLETLESLVRSLSSNGDQVPPEREHEPREPCIQFCSLLPPSLEALLQLPIFAQAPPHSPSSHGLVAGPQHTGSRAPLHTGPSGQSTAVLTDEPQELNSLVGNYFAHVHVKNPILSDRLVRQAVSSIALHGINWTPQSCLVLLICALGSISGPIRPDTPSAVTPAYANALAYFAAAEKRLGSLLSLDDIVSAQCLFLAGVFSMTVFRPRPALRFFLQALLIAEQLLASPASENRDLFESTELSQALHMRQAIYWSSWKSVVELDAALGSCSLNLRAAGQSPYPPFYPTPPSAENACDNVEVGREQETSWYFYLAEISLKRLHARLCLELNTLKEKSTSHIQFLAQWAIQVPLWEHEVQEWINSLPEALSFSAPSAADNICRFVLRGHVANAFETIYWPFTCLPLSNSFAVIEQIEPYMLKLLEKGMVFHNDQILVNQPGFRHRHHGTLFMIRACTRSSLTLVAYYRMRATATEAGNKLSVEMPFRWRESVNSVLHVLQHWADECPVLIDYHAVLEKTLSVIDVEPEM